MGCCKSSASEFRCARLELCLAFKRFECNAAAGRAPRARCADPPARPVLLKQLLEPPGTAGCFSRSSEGWLEWWFRSGRVPKERYRARGKQLQPERVSLSARLPATCIVIIRPNPGPSLLSSGPFLLCSHRARLLSYLQVAARALGVVCHLFFRAGVVHYRNEQLCHSVDKHASMRRDGDSGLSRLDRPS